MKQVSKKPKKSTKHYILSDIHMCYLFTPADATEMNLVYSADFKGIPKPVNLSVSGSSHPDPLHAFSQFT